jgi:hypothetical protein
MRRGRRVPPSLVLLGAALAAGCGTDFVIVVEPPAREAAPLAATYDVLATWPDLALPELPAVGLGLDLTLEIDPNSLGDPSGSFSGTVTIVEALAGGVPRAFDPPGPIGVAGRISGDQIDLLPFGPVTVGLTILFPDLAGIVGPDGRRMDGLARFGNLPEEGAWTGVKQRRYLVAGSDFSLVGSASIVTVRFDARFRVDADVEATSGDPVAAASGGGAFIVNRLFFDNVQLLDPARGFRAASQFSTGSGSNPHDALLVGGSRLFVTRYEPPYDDVLVADAGAAPPVVVGRIDLAPLATNSSGTPRPDRLAAVNGLLLVTLQNIDAAFFEYGPGRAAFIDPNTLAVVRAVTLAGQNPFGPPSIHPETGEVYLADAGIFQGLLPRALTGGIEVLDPVALATRGILVDDDDLGGNVSGVAVASSERGYAVVVTASGTNRIVAFSPGTGAVLGTVLAPSAFIPEIRHDGDGYVLVPEHDLTDPRLRILDGATGATIVRLPLPRPPASVAILTRDLSSP